MDKKMYHAEARSRQGLVGLQDKEAQKIRGEVRELHAG